MPDSYTIMPTEAPGGEKKHNKWIFIIGILSIWLMLGGVYFWTQSKKSEPQQDYFNGNNQPTVTTEPTNTNVNAGGGRLNPAGQKNQEEEQLPTSFLGYIKKIENQFGNYYILIDYIEWVTGDEAKQAALDAGECSVLEDCAPLGFFVRNESTLVRRFRLAPNPDIRMQTYSMRQGGGYNIDEVIKLVDFLDIFTPNSEKKRLADVPYQVKVENDQITEIREKFVPQ